MTVWVCTLTIRRKRNQRLMLSPQETTRGQEQHQSTNCERREVRGLGARGFLASAFGQTSAETCAKYRKCGLASSEGGNSPGCGAPCCIYARDSLQPSYGRFAAAGRAARFVKCGLPIQPPRLLWTPRMLTRPMLCDSAGIGRRGSGAGG